MRLAYFSPLNPVQSGISDYSEELLPWLAAWAEIDLFVDGYRPTNPTLSAFAVHEARRFPSLAARYNAIIYQMGNSPAHAYMYRLLSRFPGVVVLHEHVLHHLIAWMSWDRGDARTYLNEFRYCYGAEGEALARRIILGQASIDFFDYPLSDRVIRSARGLIVHSEYVRQAVLRVRPDAPVRVVPMGTSLPPPAGTQREQARRRLGFSPEELVIASFGHINPFKRLEVALHSFRDLRRSFAASVYVMVGSVSPNYDIADTIQLLGLDGSVRLVGYADAHTFQDYVAASDICINLRYPSAGETSASVLRLMGAGLPVLVSRTGAFEELPDGTCVKVDVDECEGDLVREYLHLLAKDGELRRRIGDNARRYVAENHTLKQAAEGYAAALRAWYPGQLGEKPLRPYPPAQEALTAAADLAKDEKHGTPPVQEVMQTAASFREAPLEGEVLDIIAQAAADMGLGEERIALQDIAQAWVELRPSPAAGGEASSDA